MELHIANATIYIGNGHDLAGHLLELPVVHATPDRTGQATTIPALGEPWHDQGGSYCGILPAIGSRPAMHMIVCAAEAHSLKWGPYGADAGGATSRHDGAANTAALMDAGGDAHPAAAWASAQSADGHTDFHLPSQTELFLASIYAPQLFNKSGWYWSSTQLSRLRAFAQDFEHGSSAWGDKGLEFRVRAFRWIPLTA